MPAFALRFVGQEALPPRLSDFDLEQFFTCSRNVAAYPPLQFQRDHRLPAALMLLLLRGWPTAGRFQRTAAQFLRKTAEALAASAVHRQSGVRSAQRRQNALSFQCNK